MWPWDHLAFGYLLYGVRQRRYRGRPDDTTAVSLAIGTQLPDVVDKPLAWSVGVLPSGLSLGHSLVFALVVTLVAWFLGSRRGQSELAAAVAIGLFSHLLLDAVFAVIMGSSHTYEFMLWPFVPAVPEESSGFILKTATLWSEFLSFLSTTHGRWFLLGDTVLLVAAAVSWYRDGAPGTLWLQKRIYG